MINDKKTRSLAESTLPKRWLTREEDGCEIMLKQMQGDDCFKPIQFSCKAHPNL